MHKAILGVVFVALLSPGTVRAEILPSFSLDLSAWEATHIIVATEGKKIDGVLEVLESWKGSLNPGESITIPELAEFSKDEARIVPPSLFERSKPRGERPRITGARMILFLREPGHPLNPQEQTARGWTGTSIGGEVQYATVWVEGKRLYAFQQQINPGPTQLTDVTDGLQSELKMKGIVRQLLALRREVDQVLSIGSTTERAKALFELAYIPDRHVHWTVFNALEACGDKATPWMRRLLQDETMTQHYGQATHVLYRGDREHVGEILTQFLREDLPYWRSVAPTLKPAWKEGLQIKDFDNRREFKARLERLDAIANTLPYAKYQPADPFVHELFKLWEAAPPPTDDQHGRNWRDALLRNFERTLKVD